MHYTTFEKYVELKVWAQRLQMDLEASSQSLRVLTSFKFQGMEFSIYPSHRSFRRRSHHEVLSEPIHS